MAIVTREGSLFIWQRSFTIAGPTAGSLSQAGGILLVLMSLGSSPPLWHLTPSPTSTQNSFTISGHFNQQSKSTFLQSCLSSSHQKYPGMTLWGIPHCYEAKEVGVGKSSYFIKERSVHGSEEASESHRLFHLSFIQDNFSHMQSETIKRHIMKQFSLSSALFQMERSSLTNCTFGH